MAENFARVTVRPQGVAIAVGPRGGVVARRHLSRTVLRVMEVELFADVTVGAGGEGGARTARGRGNTSVIHRQQKPTESDCNVRAVAVVLEVRSRPGKNFDISLQGMVLALQLHNHGIQKVNLLIARSGGPPPTVIGRF